MIAARLPVRRRRPRIAPPAAPPKQLRFDFEAAAAAEQLAAFERKAANPPAPRPGEPERIGDILAAIAVRFRPGPERRFTYD